MIRWLAALLLLLPALAHAQALPDALTLDEARSLSRDALARRVLGASGILADEVSVEGASGLGNPRWLTGITFASAPRATGDPGVCEADVYKVDFKPVAADASLLGEVGPVRVSAIHSETVYRIVDAGPLPSTGTLWTEDYGRRLAAACARTGPVIRSGPYRGLSYFAAGTEAEASFVRKLLMDLRDNTHAVICHARHSEECQARAAAFLLLSFSSATVGPCKVGERWCVAMSFNWGLQSTVLTVEIRSPHIFGEQSLIYSANVEEMQGVQ